MFSLATAPEYQDDDSSYESLFKTAHRYEQEGTSGWNGYFFKDETWDAIIQFDQLDLLLANISPYQEDTTKSRPEQYSVLRSATSFATSIAERLFRAGRIDEGVVLLKKILPPQESTSGMLCAGYVSESRLEQKHFDLAWQIANNGSLWDRAGNIGRYVQCVMAQADGEMNRAEANRALESLMQLPEQAGEEQQREFIAQSLIPQAMATLGRCKEAYALAKEERFRFELLRIILRERYKNGTQEEVDQWFQVLRKLYDDGKIPGGMDWSPTTSFLWPCLEIGKYLDAMDAIERSPGQRGIMGAPDGYFDQIPKLNIETGFRYNSKALIDRMIQYHDRSMNDSSGMLGGGQNRFQFYPQIIKAQLNLGLVDDAFESFRKITGSLEALESFEDIMFYCIKTMSPEEAEQKETEAAEIFRSIQENKEHEMGDYYLVDYFARMAVRLMKDGEAEKGSLYLKTALSKAEKETLRQEQKAGRRYDSSFSLGTVCGRLIEGGYLDEAVHIADQCEPQYIMPEQRLQIAAKRVAAGEMDEAKQAVRKAFETFSQAKTFFPPQWQLSYAEMASIAADLGDRELFYEIFDAATKRADRHNWNSIGSFASKAFGDYARNLATFGDKEHPFFIRAEKTGGTFERSRDQADLYFSLGVSRAILDDHDNARRLLKKGIEARKNDEFKTLATFCPAIVEAKSYE
jgi:hypothetical protein